MQASNRMIVDAELVFHADGQDPVSGSLNTDAIAADKLTAYWDEGRAERHQFAVVIDIEEIVADDGQTYEFNLQAGDSAAFTNPQVLQTKAADGDTDRLVFGVAREAIDADVTHFRVALVAGEGNITPALVTFSDAAHVGLEITVHDGNDSETYTFDDGEDGTLDPGADEEASAAELADAINNSSTIDCTATVDGAVVTITTNFLEAGDPLGDAAVTSENDDDPATAVIETFSQEGSSIAFHAYATPFAG